MCDVRRRRRSECCCRVNMLMKCETSPSLDRAKLKYQLLKSVLLIVEWSRMNNNATQSKFFLFYGALARSVVLLISKFSLCCFREKLLFFFFLRRVGGNFKFDSKTIRLLCCHTAGNAWRLRGRQKLLQHLCSYGFIKFLSLFSAHPSIFPESDSNPFDILHIHPSATVSISIAQNVCLGFFHPLNYSNIDTTYFPNEGIFLRLSLPLFLCTFFCSLSAYLNLTIWE